MAVEKCTNSNVDTKEGVMRVGIGKRMGENIPAEGVY